MNVLKISFLTCLLAVFAILGYSQPKLAISPAGISQSHTTINCATGDSTVTYSFRVINTGTSDYNGGIIVEAKYNSDSNVYALATQNVNDFSPLTDYTEFAIVDTIRAPYIGGGNIIIIWPQSTDPESVSTDDSATVYLQVMNCPVSIEAPLGVSERFSFSPNPVKASLRIAYLDRKELFESVRIYDLAGKELQAIVHAESEINLENLPVGMYLLKVKYDDGVEGSFRLIKE